MANRFHHLLRVAVNTSYNTRAASIYQAVADNEHFLATNNSCQWTDLLPTVVASLNAAFCLYLVLKLLACNNPTPTVDKARNGDVLLLSSGTSVLLDVVINDK